MSTSNTANKLRELRLERGMTLEQVAQVVGVGKSTVRKWETGMIENMRRDKIANLAKALGTTPSYLMGWDEPEEPISEIPCVPTCPAEGIYNSLNKAGQAEYIRYGRYLTSQEEYRALDAEPQIEYIRHYLTAAAAGYAAPIEGEDYELIPKDGSVPAQADFSIDITGDSMEPYIHDGQRVYVQRGSDKMQEFDVGIFYVDGDVFCKQWCIDYNRTLMLLSANPAREDANIYVARDSDRDVICFGKVLIGKLPRPIYK